MLTNPTDTTATTGTYRFEVDYERFTLHNTLVTGTTIVTAQRRNLGLPGATERLKSRFHRSRSVKALSIRPYLSGADRVKRDRKAKREWDQQASV